MAIPDYQTCMLPPLRQLSDGHEYALRDAEPDLAQHFGLTAAELAERLPSGQQRVFKNRLGWASSYLKKAALLESPRRGVVKITPRGQAVLAQNLARLEVKFLQQFPEFMAFLDACRPSRPSVGRLSVGRTGDSKVCRRLAGPTGKEGGLHHPLGLHRRGRGLRRPHRHPGRSHGWAAARGTDDRFRCGRGPGSEWLGLMGSDSGRRPLHVSDTVRPVDGPDAWGQAGSKLPT